MEYFWLARRIVAQMFRYASAQLQEEIVAEAICDAWCAIEPLSYGLMRICVRSAGYKHLSFQNRKFPILLPIHTLQDVVVPPPELPYEATVLNMCDYRKMPTNIEKLAF